MTLEELYLEQPDSKAYLDRRSAKIDEIKVYLMDFLENPAFSGALAREIMIRAEEMNRFDGDTVSGEVPARLTKSGNPLPLTI